MNAVGIGLMLLKGVLHLVCAALLLWAMGIEASAYAVLVVFVVAGVIWLITRHARRAVDGY